MAKECHKQFSVKTDTVFEDSPIPLDKWLTATWLVVNCKNGVSNYEIMRDLKVTQKSAWFILHRIRLALKGNKWKRTLGQSDKPVDASGWQCRRSTGKRLTYAELTGKGDESPSA